MTTPEFTQMRKEIQELKRQMKRLTELLKEKEPVDRIITTKDVAELLGISPYVCRTQIKEGLIPYISKEKGYKFSFNQIQNLIKTRCEN